MSDIRWHSAVPCIIIRPPAFLYPLIAAHGSYSVQHSRYALPRSQVICLAWRAHYIAHPHSSILLHSPLYSHFMTTSELSCLHHKNIEAHIHERGLTLGRLNFYEIEQIRIYMKMQFFQFFRIIPNIPGMCLFKDSNTYNIYKDLYEISTVQPA